MTPPYPPGASGPAVDPSDARVLLFPGGTRAEFPHAIADIAVIPGASSRPDAVVAVVQLDVLAKARLPENVFGVRRDGRIAWQIPPAQHLDADDPYVGVVADKAGLGVWCYNWDGMTYLVDPATCALLDRRFDK